MHWVVAPFSYQFSGFIHWQLRAALAYAQDFIRTDHPEVGGVASVQGVPDIILIPDIVLVPDIVLIFSALCIS
jgi:hypothetical protein